MLSSIHACFALLYLLFFAIALSAMGFITGARSTPRLLIGAVLAPASTYLHFHNVYYGCFSTAHLCDFLLLLTFIAFRLSARKLAIRRLRHMFIATTLVGLFWSTVNLFCCFDSFIDVNSIKAAIILDTVIGLYSAYVGAYSYVEIKSASNPYVFSRVCKSKAPSNFDLNKDVSCNTVLIRALITPSALIKRVREGITPTTGAYRVNSEIEFLLPNNLQIADSITLPVLFQGKCELMRNLVVDSKDGYRCRRLNDTELLNKLTEELNYYFLECHYPRLIDSKSFCAYMLQANRYQTDKQFKDDSLSCICAVLGVNSVKKLNEFQDLSENNRRAVLTLKSLLESYRFAKPVCYELNSCDRDGFIAAPVISVERTVPQVLLRERAETTFGKCFLHTKRLLTKKRMHYYFGLGMADCCESYHLTFHGLKDCYLSGLNFNSIGLGRDIFFADELNVSNRYDQQFSRLYIHEGRGFSGAALELSYEKRSHKPIAALTMAAFLCLMVMVYIYFASNLQPSSSAAAKGVTSSFNASDLLKLITILSVGNIISIWQTMEDYFAEEWLWMGVGALVVTTISALVLGLLSCMNAEWIGFIRLLWKLQICLVYFTSAGSAYALYGKIKLHGNIMHKVPVARSISDNYERTLRPNDLDSIAKRYQDAINSDSADPYFDYVFSDVDADGEIQPYAQGRVSEYEMGIYFYRALIGSNWKDGWLFPVWASSVNPYHQGSKSFIDLAMGEGVGNE